MNEQKKIFALFSFVLIIGNLFCNAQKKETDSLLLVLDKIERAGNYQNDTQYLDLLNRIGWSYLINYSYDSSLAFAQKSNELSTTWAYPKGRVDALRTIGVIAASNGDNKHAMEIFLEALTMAQNIHYVEGEGKMYRQIGIIYSNQGRYKESLSVLHKALTRIEKTNDIYEHLAVTIAIGNAYGDWGKPDSALYYDNKALKMAVAANNKTAESVALSNTANIYKEQGNLMPALENYYKALRIDEARGDLEGVTIELLSMADVFTEQGRYKQAQENLLKALKINEGTEDKRTRAFLQTALAKVYVKQHDFDQALKCYKAALEIHQNLDEPAGLSEILTDLGDLYSLQKNYREAVNTYQQSLKISENNDQLKTICAANIGLGASLLSLGENNKAKSVIQKGYQLAHEIENKKYIRDANELLSRVYEAEGNKNLALYYYKQFKLYADSINNSEANAKSDMLTAQYEYEKKEALLKANQKQKETEYQKQVTQQKWTIIGSLMALLSLGVLLGVMTFSRKKIQSAYSKLEEATTEIWKSRARIQAQSKRLEEANTTKDKLLSIIGHDLRSPLNTLNGLLTLVSTQGLSADELQEYFRKLNRSFVSTSETLENLLEWAHAQMKGFHNNPSLINLNQLVKKVAELFLESATTKDLRFSYSISQDIKIFADEDQIKLVLRNLINNAIKFTPNGGSIDIEAKQLDDFVEISIVDTGVGLNPDQLEKLFKISSHFSTKGTNGEKGSGLGLMLCKEMMEHNGGKIWASSNGESGSQFYLQLPVIDQKSICKTHHHPKDGELKVL